MIDVLPFSSKSTTSKIFHTNESNSYQLPAVLRTNNFFHRIKKSLFILIPLILLVITTIIIKYPTRFWSKAATDNSIPSPFTGIIDPQYILVRKDNTAGGSTYLWNGMTPANYSRAAFEEIITKVTTRGTNSRRLGVGALFFYNEYQYVHPDAINRIRQSLQNMFVQSEATDLPIFIALDGFQWWKGRSDLWNFWNPTLTGYDPINRNNVEWYCWDNSCAVDKNWRNWGSWQETEPTPNIMSQKYIDENQKSLEPILQDISKWYTSLSPNKKYLFAGMSLFVELDISGSYFKGGLPTNPNDRTFQNTAQLGYAAVKSAGIKSSGTLTDTDITEAVKKHMTIMYQYAYSKGIPRNKLFDHTGNRNFDPTTWPTNHAYQLSDASIIDYATTGWSMYNTNARNPLNTPTLSTRLDQLGKTAWAVPEWNPYPGNDGTETDWANALRNTLNYKNNLFLNIANWEGIYNNTNALQAIAQVLGETPSCYIKAPVINSINPSNPTTTQPISFSWDNENNIQSLTLVASNDSSMNPQGILKNLNVMQETVTGKKTYVRTFSTPGTYYFQLIADGCNYTIRKISDRGSFTISQPIIPTITNTPPPYITNTPKPSITPISIIQNTLILSPSKTPTPKIVPSPTITQYPSNTPHPSPSTTQNSYQSVNPTQIISSSQIISATPRAANTPFTASVTPQQQNTTSKSTVTFFFNFEGTPLNRNNLGIHITLVKGSDIVIDTDTLGSSDEKGIVSIKITDVPIDSYDLYVYGWAHLSKRIEGITIQQSSQTIDLTPTQILAGDITGPDGFADDTIDSLDIGLLMESWGLATNDTVADINKDGVVDGIDSSFVLQNYLKSRNF
jgi:hypothetical protein